MTNRIAHLFPSLDAVLNDSPVTPSVTPADPIFLTIGKQLLLSLIDANIASMKELKKEIVTDAETECWYLEALDERTRFRAWVNQQEAKSINIKVATTETD